MLSQLDLPTPIDIISSFVQVSAHTTLESIMIREDIDIDESDGDSLYDIERRRNSLGISLTVVELACTESRPRSSDDDAVTTFGVNLWGDAMEHMRKISEFACGDNPGEVGAMNMDSDSNNEERRLAEELADELERQRLTMQYHREVPGFQFWFDRFEIDTEFEYSWDLNECGDSDMSISDTSGYNRDEDE